MANDNIQHGIDDNPTGDAEKGAALGGLGGAAVGAAAGSLAGPLGAVVGAVAGGLIGAGASGAAVSAVDEIDNDNTVSGIGDGATRVGDNYQTPAYSGEGYSSDNVRASSDSSVIDPANGGVGGHNVVTGEPATSEAGTTGLATGAVAGGLIGTVVGGPVGAVVGGTLGSLVGGVAGDAAEAASEEPIGAYDNNYAGSAFQAGTPLGADVPVAPVGSTSGNDDVLSPSTQTDYRNVDNGFTSVGASDLNADATTQGGLGTPGVRVGDDNPGIQTGGVTTQGPDTRGVLEKTADALTGDRTDDKTGGQVLSGNTVNDTTNQTEDPIINWSGAHGETLSESRRIDANETGGDTSAPRNSNY